MQCSGVASVVVRVLPVSCSHHLTAVVKQPTTKTRRSLDPLPLCVEGLMITSSIEVVPKLSGPIWLDGRSKQVASRLISLLHSTRKVLFPTASTHVSIRQYRY